MRKGLLIFLGIVLVLLVAILVYAGYQFRDRHSDYQTDISLYSPAATVQAGFSKVDLTPTDFETWEDVDGDSKYDPEKGDRFIDANGNGEFDAVGWQAFIIQDLHKVSWTNYGLEPWYSSLEMFPSHFA